MVSCTRFFLCKLLAPNTAQLYSMQVTCMHVTRMVSSDWSAAYRCYVFNVNNNDSRSCCCYCCCYYMSDRTCLPAQWFDGLLTVIRYSGQKILYGLMMHEDFDQMMSRYVPSDVLHSINDKLDSLRCKVCQQRSVQYDSLCSPNSNSK